VIFQTSPPTTAEIQALLETGVHRFVFLGDEASQWSDIFIDYLAVCRSSAQPVDAQSMILKDESLEQAIELARGLENGDGRLGILVF